MDSSSELLRFLYIGNTQPFILCKDTPIDKEKHGKMLEFLKTSMTDEILINLVKKSLKSNSLPRHNEALFVLAYAVKNNTDKDVLHRIYEAISEMIVDCKDLFLLLHYMEELTDGKKLGFSRGLKSMLKTWYEKHTSLELVDIICKNRKMYGFSHKRIIFNSHISLNDKEKNDILQTTTKSLVKSLQNVSPEILNDPSTAFGRLNVICRIRNASSANEMIDLIKLHKLSTVFLPSIFMRNKKVWEELLPQMSYKELLDMILVFNDFQFLRVTDPFSKKYTYALGNSQALAESKILPVEIIKKMQLLGSKKRYMARVKESHHTLNMESLQKTDPNKIILNKLMIAVDNSLNHQPRIGVRFCVTLDLKKTTLKKTVFGYHTMSCCEAMCLVAFGLFKREKEVDIYAFTDEIKILKPVVFKNDMTFLEALAHCRSITSAKTVSDVTLPIKTAIASKKKYDVFITMTDSLIKINPKRKPAIEPLSEYRKHLHMKTAKHIFINLSRHTQDLNFEDLNTKGILEITGFSNDTPKIIEAFSKNLFS